MFFTVALYIYNTIKHLSGDGKSWWRMSEWILYRIRVSQCNVTLYSFFKVHFGSNSMFILVGYILQRAISVRPRLTYKEGGGIDMHCHVNVNTHACNSRVYSDYTSYGYVLLDGGKELIPVVKGLSSFSENSPECATLNEYHFITSGIQLDRFKWNYFYCNIYWAMR